MTGDVGEATRIVEFLATLSDRDDAIGMLAVAVARHPARFAGVCLEFAAADMLDQGDGTEGSTPQEVLRAGHAAFSSGHRSPALSALEREYQRRRKANNREYLSQQAERRDRLRAVAGGDREQ